MRSVLQLLALRGRSNGFNPRWAYFNLNRLGVEAWQQLDQELPGDLPLRWGGSVEWYGDDKRAAEFRGEIRHHQAWGYRSR